MSKLNFVIAYDIGTTGNKTCLYELNNGIKLIAQASRNYDLFLDDNGHAEQNPSDWWDSMCEATKEVLEISGKKSSDIDAISFCSQMQCVVLVDKERHETRRAISYMDKRAVEQFDTWRKGPACVAGVNLDKLMISLAETSVVAASAKDPVFKYTWVKENEPEVFARTYKWLDAKDYLIMRATDHFIMTEDSAFATMLYSSKKKSWSDKVVNLHNVEKSHLPKIIKSTDVAGSLTKKAAKELGLKEGCKVYGGGGDSSLIGVGTGSTKLGDTHLYIGTSGWVSTIVNKQLVDVVAMIASVVGVSSGYYNYFAEMETAGKSIEWLKENIVLDNIDIYQNKKLPENISTIEKICLVADQAEPGSGGVIFLPWLLGNRCPFEDANSRGGFFNVGLKTTKKELIRSVLEGIIYHLKWMLESEDTKVQTSKVIRLAGGGAQSPVICQMAANILNRPIEVVENPQNAGSAGAAVIMALGLGHIKSIEDASTQLKLKGSYHPEEKIVKLYEKYYNVYKRMHKTNKINYSLLNN